MSQEHQQVHQDPQQGQRDGAEKECREPVRASCRVPWRQGGTDVLCCSRLEDVNSLSRNWNRVQRRC